MTVSVLALLAAAFCALAVAAASRPLARRLRRPRLVRGAVLAAAAVLVPLGASAASLDRAGASDSERLFADGVLAVGAAALCGVAALISAHWIGTSAPRVPRRVLAVGAHPDDLEIACGGTLAKLADSGHEVRAIVMTRGERGGDAGARPGEARDGAGFLGAAEIQVMELPDTRLAERENEMTRAIEAAVRRHNPDIILTHSRNDQHQDHVAVHRATMRAARRHPAILCYESPSATSDFAPRVFVDIEDYLEVKVAAVGAHRDQRGKPYMNPEVVRGLAVVRGDQAKTRHAEGYEPVRVLGSSLADL